MISHEHRCIFVHIPRCAGTAVEEWIVGRDWWKVEPETKHLLASQAKRLYARWWDDYFKFAIVRHPYTRTISCLKYAAHFGLALRPDGEIDLSGYRALFGEDVTVEVDHRFHARADVLSARHVAGAVYGNLLDEPLDAILRYERLPEEIAALADRLGLDPRRFGRAEASPSRIRRAVAAARRLLQAGRIGGLPADVGAAVAASPPRTLGERTRREIEALYRRDFARFGYTP